MCDGHGIADNTGISQEKKTMLVKGLVKVVEQKANAEFLTNSGKADINNIKGW